MAIESVKLTLKQINIARRRILDTSEKKAEYLRTLEVPLQAQVLSRLLSKQQKLITKDLSDEELTAILAYLDPDTATDMLQELTDEKRAGKLLETLNAQAKEKITFLMRFKPESAGGLMDTNYIQVIPSAVFKDVAEQMERHFERTGKIPTIVVFDELKVLGELPAHVLALFDKETEIIKHLIPLASISYDAPTEKVIKKFVSNEHNKIIVLDNDGVILGLIYSSDIAHLIDKQKTKGLYDFAGVSGQEDIFDSTSQKVKSRYKWLIINLGTAFLAASTVGLFNDTISKYVLLASYMPIIAGMGGNAATQTLAVMVRAISLDEIDLSNCWGAIRNELGAGLINGVINGIIVAIIATVFNQDVRLGIVTGSALIINMMIAGFFGATIPLILKKMGKDPATSATVFITTATDVLGFMTFLGLATLILR
ncbi:MAG: magnesium transporter [Candidatus Roizmanbacteria bacterium]